MDKRTREAVGQLFEALTQPDLSRPHQAIVDSLGHLTGAYYIQMCNYGKLLREGIIEDTGSGAVDDVAKVQEAMWHYMPVNPITIGIEKRVGQVRRFEEAMPGTWKSSTFYNEFALKILRTDDSVFAVMSGEDGKLSYTTAMTHAGSRFFKPSTLKTLKWLVPHLSRGLQNLDRWRKLFERASALEWLMDRSDIAMLIVRTSQAGNPEIRVMSPAAERILGLDKTGVQRNLELHALLSLCTKAVASSAGLIKWRARNGMTCALRTISSRMSCFDHSCEYLVHLEPAMPERASGTGANLSPGELRIVRSVSHGLTDKQIAQAMGISPHTVRSHLRRLYRKLGVSNRAAAVNALSRMKPG